MKKIILALAIACLGIMAIQTTKAQVFTESRDVWEQIEAPGANILTSSLSIADRGGSTTHDTTYRVMICIAGTSSDSVIYMHVTHAAFGNSQNFPINSGIALTAGLAYNFEFNASDTFLYNFQVGTTTTIGMMQVDRKVN